MLIHKKKLICCMRSKAIRVRRRLLITVALPIKTLNREGGAQAALHYI